MTGPANRPSPVFIGGISARAVRGPNARGEWYWRIDQSVGEGQRAVHGNGWFMRHDVEQAVASLVSGKSRDAESAGMLVRDLMELYAGALVERPIASSTKTTMLNFARHIVRVMGTELVTKVNRRRIEAYVARRLDEPAGASRGKGAVASGRKVSPQSVLREVKLLRTAWKWAQEEGIIADPRPLPSVKIHRPADPVRNRRTPTRAEIERVSAAITERFGAGSWQEVAFWLLAETGMRLGEAFSLTWSRVNLSGRFLTVTGKMGARTVPVTWSLLEYLSDLQRPTDGEPDGPVVPGGPDRSHLMLVTLTRVCTSLSVPVFNPGGLRRAAVDALYISGVDPGVAGAIVGHSPVVALRHYRSIDIAKRVEALETALSPIRPKRDVTVVAQRQIRVAKRRD
jgi:integrase